MKNTIHSLLFSLLSLSATAASTPTKFVMAPSFSQAQLFTPRDQGVVLANLQSVSKSISGGSLQLPVELPVLVPRNFDNAFFDPMSFMLISPFQIKINGNTKNPIFSRTIEMHEYGHAIMHENLETVFAFDQAKLSALREFKKLALAIRTPMRITTQATTELQILLPGIDTTNPDMNDPRVHDALKLTQIIKAQEPKLEAMVSSNEATFTAGASILKSFVAYNEFFADVLAVSITGNPDAISDALTLTKNRINFSDRNFRIRQSRRAHSPEEHNFLTLSREFIFKYYLSDPVIRQKGRPWILSRTLESISCALKNQPRDLSRIQTEFQRLKPRVSPERFLLEGMNLAFNKCIESRFEVR